MATTSVACELWYEVRQRADENGYHFENQGREGNKGTDGGAPTAANNEPVTDVNWRNCIVWSNALSEKQGLERSTTQREAA